MMCLSVTAHCLNGGQPVCVRSASRFRVSLPPTASLRLSQCPAQPPSLPHLKSSALEIPAARKRGSTSSSHPKRRQSRHKLHPAGSFRGFKCTEEAARAASAIASGWRPTDKKGECMRRLSARACRIADNIFRRFLRCSVKRW